MNAGKGMWCAVVIAVGVAGCATIQAAQARSTERLLAEAGFEQKAADTPERMATIQALPPRKFVVRNGNGSGAAPRYVYADPTGCRCVYVGSERQYAEYKKLRREDDAQRERAIAVEEFSSPWYPDSWWW